MTLVLWLVLGVGATSAVVMRCARVDRAFSLLKAVPPVAGAALLLPVSGWLSSVYILWAAGDLFLLDKERLFIPGLVAFLLGHLTLVATFPQLLDSRPSVLVGVLAVAAAVGMCAWLWRHLRPAFRFAVPIYAAMLAAVAYVTSRAGPLAIAGAFSFLLSDTLLAIGKFRRAAPSRALDLAVLVTYYVALALLVAAFRAIEPY